jgi:predicted transposase/invertase (TIGR01784 family)
VFVELPKFKAETQTDKRMTSLWLRFMNEIGQDNEQIPDPQLQSEPSIAKAMELMQVSAFNDSELAAYAHDLDEWRSTRTLLKDHHALGKAEGKAEGLAEGELKAKTTVAQALKAQGIDSTVIAAATGLSLAEIQKL